MQNDNLYDTDLVSKALNHYFLRSYFDPLVVDLLMKHFPEINVSYILQKITRNDDG